MGISLKRVLTAFIFIAALPRAAEAAAKKSGAPSMNASSSSKKDVDRDYLVSLPLVTESKHKMLLHLEINAADEAGIAIEGGVIGEQEQLDQEEIEETGNSMKVKGMQASLLVSRYSEPTRLAGFFWAMGAGYQEYTAEWKKRPDALEVSARLATEDKDGFLHHRVVSRGFMGSARVGYRYVASEWPISIGGHLGIRHMNSKVEDIEVDDEEERELSLRYSPTDDDEKSSLRNQFMTQPDFSIDFGMIF